MIASDTTKTAKNLAKQVAKQIAQEPTEILRQAKEEVFGEENISEPAAEKTPGQPQVTEGEKAKIMAQGQRQLQALENELKEIRGEKEQGKVAAAQQEQAAKVQEAEVQKPVVEPVTKQGRRMAGAPGPKTQAQRQQTHVEKILPTSG